MIYEVQGLYEEYANNTEKMIIDLIVSKSPYYDYQDSYSANASITGALAYHNNNGFKPITVDEFNIQKLKIMYSNDNTVIYINQIGCIYIMKYGLSKDKQKVFNQYFQLPTISVMEADWLDRGGEEC